MRNLEYSWYLLSNVPGFRDRSIHYIYENMQEKRMSINDLFELDCTELSKLFPVIGHGKFSQANFLSFKNLDKDKHYYNYQKLKANNVYIIGFDDERYPKLVRENLQDSAPPILYCTGYLPLLNTEGVSIVGSRNVDENAVKLTKSVAQNLAEHGYNITSGYAKGVDTSAHLGALSAHGTTSIILSHGINYLSIKKEMRNLSWKKNSLFITQFAPDERFSGQNAMRRNKLVCAFSKAIIVIASGPEKDNQGKMSGTFDAGKSALQMNIPVFVLSPKALKPAPQGNIDLIKLGGIEFSNDIEIVEFLSQKSELIKKTEKEIGNFMGQGILKERKSKRTNTQFDIPANQLTLGI